MLYSAYKESMDILNKLGRINVLGINQLSLGGI